MEVVAMMANQGLDATFGMIALLGLLVIAGIAIALLRGPSDA